MKSEHLQILVLCCAIFFIHGCKIQVPYDGIKKWTKPTIESPIFSKGNTGFAMYDLDDKKWLANYQGEKKFTPASNTKLVTVLAVHKIFGDKIPVINYLETKDSLLLRPTGFPGFGYGEALGSLVLDSLIEKTNKPVKLMLPEDGPESYGSGWSWDDSGYAYQVPRSVLPLFGNRLTIKSDEPGQFFANDISVSAPDSSLFINQFIHQQPAKSKYNIPFLPDTAFLANYLSQHEKISIDFESTSDLKNYKVLSIPAFPFYQQILEVSDNFLSEQLLLMASKEKMNAWEIDDFVEDFVVEQFVKDRPAWVDGSGLSRYNAFSPEHMITILNLLAEECGIEKLIEMLPEGGKEGTLKEHYKSIPAGNLFAKTGTLRHIHCLSGVLITKAEKRLFFSYMHNQIDRSNREWKSEMEKQLLMIYENY